MKICEMITGVRQLRASERIVWQIGNGAVPQLLEGILKLCSQI